MLRAARSVRPCVRTATSSKSAVTLRRNISVSRACQRNAISSSTSHHTRTPALAAQVPARHYAKAARAAEPPPEEAKPSDVAPRNPEESLDEDEERKKKEQIILGPAPLSLWTTSDREYVDEKFMRFRDLYRVTSFDLQESVRLRNIEYERYLDEFKRRLRTPHFIEYLKNQQQLVAEYRPLIRAALKQRRQAYKDYVQSIDRKIETEVNVTNEELQKMVHGEGSKNGKEMGQNFKTVLRKMYESRILRIAELAQDPAGTEFLDLPVDLMQREVWEDQLSTTPKEGSNIADNKLAGEWLPPRKHLDNGSDDELQAWHDRKDILRSQAKLRVYGLRTFSVDVVPPKNYHRKHNEELNKRAREIAEKLSMPEYLVLPPIPKDLSPEKREYMIKLHLLIHEARRVRLTNIRRDLDKEESLEKIEELQQAVFDPTGFEAFVTATPKESNYQLAALLIQLEHAQKLVATGEPIKNYQLMNFDEAVNILRRIVKERNIPFAYMPPRVSPDEVFSMKPNDSSIFEDDDNDEVASALSKRLAEDLGEANPVVDKVESDAKDPAVDAATTAAAETTDKASTTTAATSDATTTTTTTTATTTPPTSSTAATPEKAARTDEDDEDDDEINLEEMFGPTPELQATPTPEPIPPFPRIPLNKKLTMEEMAKLEEDIRQLEARDVSILPRTDEYIEQLRYMLDAYSMTEIDYSFLDKPYDVEISHRYSFFPEVPSRYATKVKQMHERRVRMVVKLGSLGLPRIVRDRLIAIAGTRYTPETDKLLISSESKPSSRENIKYVKKLLQRLIAEAYLAHPRYVSLDDLQPPKQKTLGDKLVLPKKLPLKFGIFNFRRPLFLDSDWQQLKAELKV